MRFFGLSLFAAMWVAIAAFGQSSTRPASDQELDDLLAAIDRRAGAITDLSADFVQLKHTALLKKPLQSKGTMRVKGDLMRWDTTDPTPGVMTIDADEMRLYSPGQKLLEVYPMQKGLGQIAASPLPRLVVVREHFLIDRTDWPTSDDRASKPDRFLAIRLTPRADSLRQHVQEVRVLLEVETGCAVAVRMIDPDGDELEIAFSNLRANAGLRDEQVRFDPPSGTTISRPMERGRGAGGSP